MDILTGLFEFSDGKLILIMYSLRHVKSFGKTRNNF
jgi:hypothetical protein